MLWTKTDKPLSMKALAPKSFFYAPIPMLLLDREGLIIEVNCALRELAKADIHACKGQRFNYLKAQISTHLEGRLISSASLIHQLVAPPGKGSYHLDLEDLGHPEESCRYQTPDFGQAQLRVSETPLLDTSSGAIQGLLLSLEIIEIERRSQYREALRHRIRHELMWEIYAASYDQVLLELPFYQEVLQRHIAAMNQASIMNILDVGAGTGNVAIQLLRENKIITAVDTSNAMLNKCYSKIDDTIVSRFTIIEDTAERLPHLPDACFDGITVLLAFFDMRNPFAALEEAIRLLKPGGTLIVTEPKACFNVTALMTFAENHLRENNLMGRLAEDWTRIQTVAPHINQKIQEVQTLQNVSQAPWHAETLHAILAQRGFTALTFEDAHLGNCATITGIKP